MKVIGFVVLISTLLLKVKCERPHLNPVLFKTLCTVLVQKVSGLLFDVESRGDPSVMDQKLVDSVSVFKEKLKTCEIACREIDDVVLPLRLEEEIFINDAMMSGYGLKGRIDLDKTDRKIYYFIDTAFTAAVPLLEIIKQGLFVCIFTGDFSAFQEIIKTIAPNQSGFKMNTTIISISITLILVISNYLFG
ncbi:putative integral membrane protein [Theileria parva strain Muguga]|uniref:Uncharacterized protein n=1 Tax=Theileria parva TaxID=5875 RepID=Q4N0W6_THEPA|nr:putative integral membrane protein [Theileria parva strain Muguga]EAN30870.1 putative integral membrane protein [Theileria parva strain Muguga]|eukprot:XP_763153.1 hypothetical protein [Theileria parva strain Muguga]